MFGDEFGLAYFEQRHAELLKAAERARLVRSMQETRRAEQGQQSLSKRVLAATGDRLILVGNKLQQVAAQ